jgi:hypothetical protein
MIRFRGRSGDMAITEEEDGADIFKTKPMARCRIIEDLPVAE